MSATEPLIRNISDTARWAAVYRARETERPDPLFRDPLARRLAGERGEQIAAGMKFTDLHTWTWVTRTYLLDAYVREQVARGVDLVVNLAAGLDTRPYRMELPASLRWVEVDLPALLDYKEELLRGETPRCKLERVRLDLSQVDARRTAFARIGSGARDALIVTEGLLIYLQREAVAALAEDLANVPAFRNWVLDLASPALVKMLQKRLGARLNEANAPLVFGPPEGPEFFVPHGWKPAEVRSMLKTAARLKRLPWFMKLIALFPEPKLPVVDKPWSGICRFERR